MYGITNAVTGMSGPVESSEIYSSHAYLAAQTSSKGCLRSRSKQLKVVEYIRQKLNLKLKLTDRAPMKTGV